MHSGAGADSWLSALLKYSQESFAHSSRREMGLHPRHGPPTDVCRPALGIPVCSLWLLRARPELCPWGCGGRSSSIRILSPASCPRKCLSQPPCALHMIFSERPRQLGHFRGECGASGGEGTGLRGPWGYPHSPVHWDPEAINLGFHCKGEKEPFCAPGGFRDG